mmetsp:Transcript_4437/g.13464  ORF Transcript_4437/g.13464 Transcript_4437/m.13464 type:complete len:300 (-) Transcript_4437:572-1471(-)
MLHISQKVHRIVRLKQAMVSIKYATQHELIYFKIVLSQGCHDTLGIPQLIPVRSASRKSVKVQIVRRIEIISQHFLQSLYDRPRSLTSVVRKCLRQRVEQVAECYRLSSDSSHRCYGRLNELLFLLLSHALHQLLKRQLTRPQFQLFHLLKSGCRRLLVVHRDIHLDEDVERHLIWFKLGDLFHLFKRLLHGENLLFGSERCNTKVVRIHIREKPILLRHLKKRVLYTVNVTNERIVPHSSVKTALVARNFPALHFVNGKLCSIHIIRLHERLHHGPKRVAVRLEAAFIDSLQRCVNAL